MRLKKITLYDAGMGAFVAWLGAGVIVLIPLIVLIAVLVVKTFEKIKQYRMEEEKLIENELTEKEHKE